MKLFELQNDDKKAKKLRSEELLEGRKDIEQIFYYQGLMYVPKVIRSELISPHHNDPLTSHFVIEKTQDLIAKKYYYLIL